MKLVDLPDECYFVVPDSKRLKGIFLKRKYDDGYNLVVARKAPYFDKVCLLDPLLEIKKFDEELICHGT